MATKKWCGTTEADAIATFNTMYKDADPNARYYQDTDGLWYIEADAMKVNIPAVQVEDENGQTAVMTMEDYQAAVAAKQAEVQQ